MGYDLLGKNKDSFYTPNLGTILELTNYLYPVTVVNGKWMMAENAGEIDPRFNKTMYGEPYPSFLTNSGFKVTEEEAKIMARFARNWAYMHRGWPGEKDMHKFADFAEKSGGFKIC